MSDGTWIHGTQLGRAHQDLRQHLAEDHAQAPAVVSGWSDRMVSSYHDGAHGTNAAYAKDVPHDSES